MIIAAGCLHCYFRFIEDDALPSLPEGIQMVIRRMHSELRARGMPVVAVNDLAAFELAVCRQHCPPDVVARIEADHRNLRLGHGQANTG